MASNSKKRRRVLGASCILAALIIASSSFAWFTSSDEVTNRLSANADYGTKIVESFAPPKNWIPGQEVNKDVYALNTGSVEALVNEDVSGILTYTVVQKVQERDDNCVKLTADEVDAVKAGAYLAGAFKADGTPMRTGEGTAVSPYVYNPELGNIAEYFNNGKDTNPKTTEDFTPTAAGLYIFRRSIDVDATEPYAETFTYDGYYFDGAGNYYKLAEVKTNSYVGANADDGITTDGNLTKAPKVLYEKEQQGKAVPTLTYEEKVGAGDGNTDTNHPKRLVATVKTGTDATGLNGANVDSLAIAADHALAELESKKSALETAKQALEDASSAYQVALDTIAYYAGAGADYANAKAIEAGDLNAIDEDGDFTSYEAKTVPKIVGGVTKTKLDNYNTVQAKWAALGSAPTVSDAAMTAAKSTMESSLSDFESKKAAYEAATGYPYTSPVTDPDPEDTLYVVWTAENKYETDKTAYETAKLAYDQSVAAKEAYDAKKDAYEAQMDGYAAAIVSDVAAIKAAITARNNADPGDGSADGKQKDYNTALSQYNSALGDYETALATYNNAAAAYQVAVDNDTEIVIYINLSDDVVTDGSTSDKWLLAPVADGDDTVAHFYYTTALAGGQSTAKLVDSIALSDKTTQNDYKSFDFDLNVALDSAQVTYDDTNSDGQLYSGKATNTAAFDGYKADFTDPTDITSTVVWTPTT